MSTIRGRLAGNSSLEAVATRLALTPTTTGSIFGITLAGLFVRLLWLASRPMHFDEARVAYWILRSTRTGQWEYRFIIHGPLVQHVNRHLFAIFGSGDFVARLPVAIVGALLPLSVLLYRDRLRDRELVALAGLFAFNPLLWYYSRFMRSDVLVGVFAFVALGFFLRLYETRRPGYLYAGVLAFALSFASKENAVVYLLCWGGMFGLVAGLEVIDPRRFESQRALFDFVEQTVAETRAGLTQRVALGVVGHALAATVVFLLVTFFLFAPRAPAGGGVGLYQSPLTETLDATIASMQAGYDHWVGGSSEIAGCGGEDGFWGKYFCNLGRELSVMLKAATAVGLLSLVGLWAEFRRPRPRVLVPAAFYWGVASLVGYPLGTDIVFPPWVTLHAVIPLAIPAAVGLVTLVEWVLESIDDGDYTVGVSVGVALLLLLTSVAGVGIHFNYVGPTDYSSDSTVMVQFAQPEQGMKAGLDATKRASADNDGLDVLVYSRNSGGRNSLVDMGGVNDRAIPCMKFIRGLPISWYLYSYDAAVTCADNQSSLQSALEENPPVVITQPDSEFDVRAELADDDYVAVTYQNRRNTREVIYYFDTSQVRPPAAAEPISETRTPAIGAASVR